MRFNPLAKTALAAVFALLFSAAAAAQAKPRPPKLPPRPGPTPVKHGPTVTQINIDGLRELIKPKGKPLLINFWATWCDPCREEFPDLVKIDQHFKGKIDFITISLDDLAEIKTSVPKFLREVKAEMPAYLLRTADESAAIALVAKNWSGNLPMTVLFNPAGETAYIRMGVVKHDVLTAEIEKVLGGAVGSAKSDPYVLMDFVKIKDGRREEAFYFYENNWKVYREEALKRGIIHSFELIDARSEKNSAFDIVLVTRFMTEAQYKDSERNFEPILKKLRPNGPVLKTASKPADFRENVFVYSGPRKFAGS